ncbi:MAG: hypothetical protein JXN62_06445 [Bacteroidales bacterium]|nr:hypothetical protein [Bacteroidales bacterium]
MEAESTKEKNRKKAIFWANHIKCWEESGLSQIDYCRANNLSRHHFTYWKCKNNRKNKPVKFIPVVTKSSTASSNSSTEPLKVHVGDKYRIEVGEGFSGETLIRLINTLSDM